MKFTINWIFSPLVVNLCIPVLLNAQGLDIDKIIGIVGDKIILKSQVDAQYYQYLSKGGTENEELKCSILNQMYRDRILLMQANLDSIQVTNEEIENELDRRVRYFTSLIGSKEKLEEYYQKSIVEIKEEFRKDIENQLLSNKMRSEAIKNVRITPSEVKIFFSKIPKDSLPFFNAELEVGQIVRHPEVNKSEKDMAKEKIENLKKRVTDGEDFSTLALLYSEDPGSAQNGGELGFMERGDLVAEFQEAAFKLKPGDFSDIVKTQFGYHLIQMIERRGETINVRHILIKPIITSKELANAAALLDSVSKMIRNDSVTFSSAVRIYSNDEESKNNGGMLVNPQIGSTFFESDQLDPSVYFVVEKLEPGDISEPVLFTTKSGEKAYRLLYLKSETEPHQASLKQDYDKIRTAALNEKQNDVIENWYKDSVNKTYIYLDPDYYSCNELIQWIKPANSN